MLHKACENVPKVLDIVCAVIRFCLIIHLGCLLKSAGCFLPGYKGFSSQGSLRLLLEPFGHHHHLSDVGNILQARVFIKSSF